MLNVFRKHIFVALEPLMVNCSGFILKAIAKLQAILLKHSNIHQVTVPTLPYLHTLDHGECH